MKDKVSLFLDHFIIYSKNREALILNSGTASAFEESLRELISSEIRDTLLDRVKILNYDMKDTHLQFLHLSRQWPKKALLETSKNKF